MSGECQVNIKSLSELDIGGRETCLDLGIFALKNHGVLQLKSTEKAALCLVLIILKQPEAAEARSKPRPGPRSPLSTSSGLTSSMCELLSWSLESQ